MTKPMDEVLEFLRSFIYGGVNQDFRPWARELYAKLYGSPSEPSEVPDCPRCGVAHYPPCPERPLGHTGGSDCPCSECVAWRTSKSGEGQ